MKTTRRAAACGRGVALAMLLGCGGHVASPGAGSLTAAALGAGLLAGADGHPPLAFVTREGDGRGAIAVALSTDGIAPERGAMAAVALVALVEARLAARGLEVTASAGWSGWRLRVLLASPAEAAPVIAGIRAAMLAPVTDGDPALVAVARKTGALLRRPLADASLRSVASCTGEAYSVAGDSAATASDVEGWRRRAHGLGRLALAVAGDRATSDAALRALAATPPWPLATALAPAAWRGGEASLATYDASGEIPAGSARVVVVARTVDPNRAVAAARDVGDPRGPLASRLAALEAPARVQSVAATAHVDGGCLAVRLDLAAADVASDLAARVATVAALARQEIAVEVADAVIPPSFESSLAARAADPRDAAERAAWWLLARAAPQGGATDAQLAVTVGVASPRSAPDAASTASTDAIRSAVDRATLAWHAPVVEERARVEPGQGELWLLLASPCGTTSESTADAGMGAEVAMTAAARAAEGAGGDVRVEPFVAADGLGLLVHGAAREGERPEAHARRLADLAARAFAADALDPRWITETRTALLLRNDEAGSRSLAGLGAALAQGHPSWIAPFGTRTALASSSDEALAAHAAALRAGPLRVAVLANAGAAQADAAARSVDRWIARRPGEERTCGPRSVPAPPRPGTYAVEAPPGAPSEALFAVPLAPGDDGAAAAASWVAAALDGADGLLAKALGGVGQDGGRTPLARSWSASVLSATRPTALVVRVVAEDPSLDAAVAQTRVLLDRVRQGALGEDDRTRAGVVVSRARLAASLDPRARTIALWRGESPAVTPSLDAMRAFAAAALHDDALVIVASRPPRPEPAPRTPRETRGRSR